MNQLSIWHWIVLLLGVFLLWHLVLAVKRSSFVAGFREGYTGKKDEERVAATPTPRPHSVRAKALRFGRVMLFAGLGVQLTQLYFRQTEEALLRVFLLLPAWWLLGCVVGCLFFGTVALIRAAHRGVRVAAPRVSKAVARASEASMEAVKDTTKQPLTKRLEEIERLYASGAITAEERAAARASALSRL